MTKRRIRLGIVVTHPIQYHAPLYRILAGSSVVNIEVVFLTRYGLEESFDPGFNRKLAYDVPLLDGFPHRFVRNRAPRERLGRPFGVINPGLAKVLTPERFDALLVHGYGHLSEWLAYFLASAHHIPYLLRGESRLRVQGPVTRTRRLAKSALVGTLVRRAGACLTIGEENRQFYLCFGAVSERVIPAPYSVDNQRFSDAGEVGRKVRRERLEGLGLDPSLPLVLFAGKLDARKRPYDVLDAVRQLSRPCNLVYVGDGQLYGELAHNVERESRVRLVGFVNQREIGEWYGMAEAFVLPSDYEPWGLAVNEAMASGTIPVVSDAVGCARDLVTAETGRVFPTGNVGALAAALDEIVFSPDQRARMLRDGEERIKEFDVAVTARGIETGAGVAVKDRCRA